MEATPNYWLLFKTFFLESPVGKPEISKYSKSSRGGPTPNIFCKIQKKKKNGWTLFQSI